MPEYQPVEFAAQDPPGGKSGAPESNGPTQSPGAELLFRVELWNSERTAVERVLAVASSVSIGYAAYYAALQDFPDRYVTYRHRDRMIAHSNVAPH